MFKLQTTEAAPTRLYHATRRYPLPLYAPQADRRRYV